MLTICVDNTLKFDLGRFASINYEGTQTNWNGIVGRIELRAVSPVSIEDMKIYPDVDHSVVKANYLLCNRSGHMSKAELYSAVLEEAGGISANWLALKAENQPRSVSVGIPIEKPILWSEFSPKLYSLRASLQNATERKDWWSDYKDWRSGHEDWSSDRRTAKFGLRKLEIRGTQFYLNGRPLFLRGTLECAIFPKTGYPPMDVPAWQRIFRILKSYGLNFMRFHSWCPPEAAFAAADIEGIYLQVEGPEANIRIDRHTPIGQFVEQELLRIVRTFGNHPSFLLMTTGNEHRGVGDTMEHWVKMLRDEDARHLYASSSYGQDTKNSQFIESTAGRGVHGAGTTYDLRAAIAGRDRPTIGHEIGQWTFFPNFDEIPKYSGVLQAKNFELVRDDLAKKHLLDLAPQFVQATGRQAILLYKEEIESLRRTPGYAGFSLLDMHDYPGQGTALVGPLDPFWDSKGFITPAEHARYCGPTAPLLRLTKRTFTTDETLTAVAEISHFGRADLSAAVPEWSIRDEKGLTVASGAMPPRAIPGNTLSPLGTISASLAKAAAPCKLTASVSIRGTPIGNSWDIWVYPAKVDIAPPKDLILSHHWNDEVKTALARGGRVLLFATSKNTHSLRGHFRPVFWSPVWFPQQDPNTMGILCDPTHPALADFPTEFHSNWQWFELQDRSRSFILDDTPADYRPMVIVMDNFARNHKLGLIFEARVGRGRLLVCGIDLPALAEKQPAARQLLASLERYAGSDRFAPPSALSVDALGKILGEGGGGETRR